MRNLSYINILLKIIEKVLEKYIIIFFKLLYKEHSNIRGNRVIPKTHLDVNFY